MCGPNYNKNTVIKPKITMFLGSVLGDFHPVSNLKLLLEDLLQDLISYLISFPQKKEREL